MAANIQNLIASIGSIRAEEILSLDSTDKQEGFRELEAWVAVAVTLYRVSSPTSYFCDTLNVLWSSLLFFSQYSVIFILI